MSKRQFDWQGLELAAVDYMVTAVKRVHEQYSNESMYGAIFHAFYGDGSIIYWPCVAIGTEESLAQVVSTYQQSGYTETIEQLNCNLRWSAADLLHCSEPTEIEDNWAESCCEFASHTGKFSYWEKTYDHFMHIFPQAAKKAWEQLLQEGVVDDNFIAITADEAGDLIPLSLTKAQLFQHFPQYAAAEQERQYISSLPIEQQVAELVAKAVKALPAGALYDEYEELLKTLGARAVPELVAVVRQESAGEPWRAIKLLAEINEASPDVLSALITTLDNSEAEASTRSWAASALARLDRMDLVAERIPELPLDIAASGLTAPYCSFRDNGKHHLLDYQPLEWVLSQYPHIESAVANALSPGRGFCTISPEEETAAQAGLNSSWSFIRYHAESVLEEMHNY